MENKISRKDILETVFRIFMNGMATSKKAQEYSGYCGISPEKVMIGYNSAQYYQRRKFSKKQIEACIEAGLLKPYNGKNPNSDENYTPFAKEAIIFPLFNKNNELVNIFGKVIKDQKEMFLNEEGYYPNYPKDKEQYHLLITENIIDAATIYQESSIRNKYGIIALMENSRFPDGIYDLIKHWQDLQEITFIVQKNTHIIQGYAAKLKETRNDISLSISEIPTNDSLNGYLLAHTKP